MRRRCLSSLSYKNAFTRVKYLMTKNNRGCYMGAEPMFEVPAHWHWLDHGGRLLWPPRGLPTRRDACGSLLEADLSVGSLMPRPGHRLSLSLSLGLRTSSARGRISPCRSSRGGAQPRWTWGDGTKCSTFRLNRWMV